MTNTPKPNGKEQPHSIPILSNLDEEIVSMILDIYTQKTNSLLVLYLLDSDKIIKPIRYALCDFCIKVDALTELCDANHKDRGKQNKKGFGVCHAGLHNYIEPIFHEKRHVATLMVGQVILSNEERKKEAAGIFQSFLENNEKFKKSDMATLESKYKNVKTADGKEINVKLIKELGDIQKYILELVYSKRDEIEKRESDIGRLTHGFQSPIQNIVGKADRIREKINDEKIIGTLDRLIDELKKLSDRASDMNKSMQELFSQDREKMLEKRANLHDKPYKFEKDDILEILSDSVETFQAEAEKKGLSFVWAEKKNWMCNISKPHLKIAFDNLIQNAVKYSFARPGGWIDIIQSTDSNDEFCIKITNYGLGILPEEIRSRVIFRKEARGKLSKDDAIHGRDRPGSGIGLFQAEEILTEHDGRIEVTSWRRGTGHNSPYRTTFYIYLPISEPKEESNGES